MKKIKIILVCLFLVLCLTGCGEKKLVCTNSMNEEGISLKAEYVMKFKKDVINTAKATITVDVTNEEIKKEWDKLIDEMEKEFDVNDIKSKKGITVKTSENKNKGQYKIVMDVNLTKASKTDLDNISLGFDIKDKEESSYASVKKDFESLDFSCK